MKINLYDFDNTIYQGDSSTDFFFYSLMKYPKGIIYFPKILLSCFLYVIKVIDKTKLKESFFSFLKVVKDVDSLVNSFWKSHECYIKDFYLKKKHDKDIIISASPEFLLKPICQKLKVKDLIASDVNKKNGQFRKKNCHGKEKVRRLKEKYSDFTVLESYSDSLSDTPILNLAQKAYLVKKNKITKF